METVDVRPDVAEFGQSSGAIVLDMYKRRVLNGGHTVVWEKCIWGALGQWGTQL